MNTPPPQLNPGEMNIAELGVTPQTPPSGGHVVESQLPQTNLYLSGDLSESSMDVEDEPLPMDQLINENPAN
jgi:hypothetical protein